jgi:hypothetical protein
MVDIAFTATWEIREKSSVEFIYLLLVKVGHGANCVKLTIVLAAPAF